MVPTSAPAPAPAPNPAPNPNPNPKPPKEWSKEVNDMYEPIRVLGQGGFASVMLARNKVNKSELVAMKVVGHNANTSNMSNSTMSLLAYAHREIDILRELNHPNIMKVLHYWEPPTSSGGSSATTIIALSYAKGPTVEALIGHGGALSNIFGRVVVAQIVDAVAYLHSHAVVHRDIKPDNILVAGASSRDATVWDNPETKNQQEPPWKTLRNKWHVTLVDFGFARALTPEDVAKPSLAMRQDNLNASFHAKAYDLGADAADRYDRHNSSLNASSRSKGSLTGSGRQRSFFSRKSTSNLDVSRRMVRKMSALGNRQYAAPEILKVQRQDSNNNNDNSSSNSNIHGAISVTDTISNFVAEYGLLVDAYSLGFTIRYMMTGVPPSQRVQDAIAEQNSMVNRLGRWMIIMCSCTTRSKKKCDNDNDNNNNNNNSTKRKKRYRLLEDLPGEVQRMIAKMTEKSEKKRTSVRAARRYPWVNDVLPHHDQGDGGGASKAEIKYLSFTIKKKDKKTHKMEEGPVAKDVNDDPRAEAPDTTATTTTTSLVSENTTTTTTTTLVVSEANK